MIDSSIRQVNSLFTINAMIQPKKSITLTQSQQMHFSQICHEKNSQSVLHSKLAAPKKSQKCSPNFSPSFSFGWSGRRRKPARLPWTRDPSVATRIPPRSAMPLGLRQHPAMRHRHVRHKIPGHPLGSSMLQRAHETLASTTFQKISEEFITKHVFHDSFQKCFSEKQNIGINFQHPETTEVMCAGCLMTSAQDSLKPCPGVSCITFMQNVPGLNCKWSCKFSPTPGKSWIHCTPASWRDFCAPMPFFNNKCGEPRAPALRITWQEHFYATFLAMKHCLDMVGFSANNYIDFDFCTMFPSSDKCDKGQKKLQVHYSSKPPWSVTTS